MHSLERSTTLSNFVFCLVKGPDVLLKNALVGTSIDDVLRLCYASYAGLSTYALDRINKYVNRRNDTVGTTQMVGFLTLEK